MDGNAGTPNTRAPRSLRIAIVSTCALSTPPKAYGGTELVIAELADELVRLGHRPIVFATRDSTCAAARCSSFSEPVWPPDDFAELRHASAAWREIAATKSIDVVHLNHPNALAFTSFVHLPVVATIHHDRHPRVTRHYSAFSDVAFVAISRRQAELVSGVPVRAVIHHGVDVDRYPAGPGGTECVFLGRFAPTKAPHLAIDAARHAGVPIVLGGEAHPPDRDYFAELVVPRLGPGASWIGELDQAKKTKVLGAARCTLFPIEWEEPFGLVMIESMLTGTPVIAFARGAAPEVVDVGVTGFLVHTVEEMAEKIRLIPKIDRDRCREVARKRWNVNRMAREYVALYEDTISRAEKAAQSLSSREGGVADAAVPTR